MCGIIGYIGKEPAVPILIEGLKKLEYRGYDSSGVAVMENGRIEVRRAVGKLQNLETLLRCESLGGRIGVGHVRWATHGRPSEENAHPHRAGRIVVVHNGIIENYAELRESLRARYERAGVPVVEWLDGVPLDVPLEEVAAFRRYAGPVRA